jgi:CAAX protease family protein
MDNNLYRIPFRDRSAISQLIISLFIILAAGGVLFSLLITAGKYIFDTDPGIVENLSLATGREDLYFLRYIIVSQDISFFIVPAVIILFLLRPGYQAEAIDLKGIRITDVILVVVLAFCIIPVSAFTGRLNALMEFHGSLSGVGHWMKEKEDWASQLIDLFMTGSSFLSMLLNLLIIALIPAVGEELIFRGVFQKIFQKMVGSGHIAILITSVLFSAVHFQFFGFLPRLILGLIFGYLFLWSGSLWLPVISHFVNNAIPTVGAYLKGWNAINGAPEVTIWEQFAGMVVPLLIAISILIYLRKRRWAGDGAETGNDGNPGI